MNCDDNPQDVDWTAGDDETLTFRYLSSERTPINLTGATITMQLRRKVSSNTANLSLTATWNSTTGDIIFNATNANTRSLLTSGVKRKYVYDVQVSDSNDKITTIVSGTITVNQDITR